MDLGRNVRGVLQHGGYAAVLFFGKPNRLLNGLARNVAGDRVNQLDGSVNGGRVLGTFGLRPDFEPREGFAFFAQNADNVGRGAGAERQQNKLHGARSGVALPVGVDHNSMPARRAGDKALAVGPIEFGFHHVPILLLVGYTHQGVVAHLSLAQQQWRFGFASYCALTNTDRRVFSHSSARSALLLSFWSKEIVNCSTGTASAVFFMSTRARSWSWWYSVPHCPVCLLMISFHVAAEGRVYRVYFPAGTFAPPMLRSISVVRVVASLAPVRHTLS